MSFLQRSTSEVSADRALALWARLWAAAALFHMAVENNFLSNKWYFGLTLAAVTVLWLPHQMRWILLCAGLQLVVLYQRLPFVSNHWLFTGFINVALLSACLLVVVLRGKRSTEAKAEIWSTFAPIARVCLIILYFFVVLHKLNWDFLDPSLSCAVTLYGKLRNRYAFLPQGEWIDWITIWGTIVIEAAIPILLYLARFRMLGVLSSLLLHFIIASGQQYVNFSSMIFASLALWVFDESHRVDPAKMRNSASRGLRWWIALPGIVATLAAGHWVTRSYTAKELDVVVHSIWLVYAAFGAGFLLTRKGLLARSPVPGREMVRIAPKWLMAIPALLLLNGFCPYLGLKTETSFAMFSNLRTERRQFNHVFIPSWLQVFPYQDDLVEVKSASNNRLKKYIARKQYINFATLRTLTARKRKGYVVYMRDGQLYEVPNVSKDPILSQPYPTWKMKLLHFKPLFKSGRNRCQH